MEVEDVRRNLPLNALVTVGGRIHRVAARKPGAYGIEYDLEPAALAPGGVIFGLRPTVRVDHEDLTILVLEEN